MTSGKRIQYLFIKPSSFGFIEYVYSLLVMFIYDLFIFQIDQFFSFSSFY